MCNICRQFREECEVYLQQPVLCRPLMLFAGLICPFEPSTALRHFYAFHILQGLLTFSVLLKELFNLYLYQLNYCCNAEFTVLVECYCIWLYFSFKKRNSDSILVTFFFQMRPLSPYLYKNTILCLSNYVLSLAFVEGVEWTTL